MSKCIGDIAHDAVGSLATHQTSKSFGDLFEEKQEHTAVKTLFASKRRLTTLYTHIHDVNAWVDPLGLAKVFHLM